jgi:hypothetical protein
MRSRTLPGEKWSDDIAARKPAASASTACTSSRLGGICSCEQCRPMSGGIAQVPTRLATAVNRVGYVQPMAEPARVIEAAAG